MVIRNNSIIDFYSIIMQRVIIRANPSIVKQNVKGKD